jgi:hypothetical protein
MEKYTPRNKPAQPVKQRCHRCRGTGRVPCQFCGGKGEVVKGRDVFGNPQFGRCDACFGLKSTRCTTCGGEGFV